jgi:hypothetical protein
MSITTLGKKESFVLFGCWNKGKCGSDTPFTKVLSKMKKQMRPPTAYFILGDNEYPEKTKRGDQKTKTYNMKDMISGFERLATLQPSHVPKYILLGNHDVEYLHPTKDIQIITQTPTPTLPPPCIILNEQQSWIANHTSFQTPLLEERLVMTHEFTHVLMVMIDSNIYSDEVNFDCYGKGRTRDELVQQQQREIEEIVAKNQKEIYVAMHHPAVAIKQKPKHQEKIVLTLNDELFHVLFLLAQDRPTIRIFCADFHLFLECSFQVTSPSSTLRVHQYIVATGGAELDTGYYPMDTTTVVTETKNYRIDEYQTHKIYDDTYGFYQATFDKQGRLHGKFISASASAPARTIRRRTRRHQTRKKGG